MVSRWRKWRFRSLLWVAILTNTPVPPGRGEEPDRPAQAPMSVRSERDRFSGLTVVNREMAYDLMDYREVNAPLVGERAPGFFVHNLEGDGKVSLQELHRDRPVVLILTSWGCDIFRESLAGIQALYGRYRKEVNFVMIYIREAHPRDGFASALGRVNDARTLTERVTTAQHCRRQLRLPFPVLVDGMNDPVATQWASWPVRLFVVGRDGVVLYAGAQGPWGYRPYRGFQHGNGQLSGWDLNFSEESLEEFLESRFGPDKSEKEPTN